MVIELRGNEGEDGNKPNATKGEKTYYGGDLLLSTPIVTISKSNGALSSKNVTVSSPDGQVIGMPALPWNAGSSYFWIAMNTAKSSGTSFDMFVDGGQSAPVGTYQLHITSNRTQQAADGWQYDGFITVHVVN